MELAPTNWGAVTAGTAIYVIIGAIWYSPKLFGGLWMSANGLTKEQCRNPGAAFLLAVINAFVAVFVLSQFIHHTEAHATSDGACVAFWAWLGFIVTTHFSGVIWERRPISLFFVHIGCMLLSTTATGALLAVWK